MQTIDYLHLVTALLFFVAAIHKLYRKQSEHFFTRFLVSIWFFLTVANMDMPVQFVRVMSNYIIMIVPFIEIIAPAFLKYFRGKK